MSSIVLAIAFLLGSPTLSLAESKDTCSAALGRTGKSGELFQRALQVYKADPKTFSRKIQTLNVTNQRDLFELAKIVATAEDETFEEFGNNFKNYQIRDAQARLELAKIYAAKNRQFPSNVQNFELESEADRFEVAKLAAKKSSFNFSKYFEKFGVTNPQWRFELALIAVSSLEYSGDGQVGEYIKNFGLQNQAELFQLAKVYAENKGWVGLYAANFNLLSEQDRVEIAKITARTNAKSLMYNFEEFNITDSNSRFEVLKIVATESPEELGRNFERIKIYDLSQIIALAKILAEKGMLDSYLKKFGYLKPKVMIELARLSAKNSVNFPSYVDTYEISDKNILLELAESVVHGPGRKNMQRHLRKFGINEPNEAVHFLKRVPPGADLLADIAKRYELTDRKHLAELLLAYMNYEIISPVAHVASVFGERHIVLENFENLPFDELQKQLEHFHVMEQSRFAMLSSTIKRTDVLSKLWLAQVMLDWNPSLCTGCLKAKTIQEFFSSLVGLPDESAELLAENSLDTQGQIMSVGLDLFSRVGFGYLSKYKVGKETLNRKQSKEFLEVLSLLRGLAQMGQTDFFASLHDQSTIQELRDKFFARVAKQFEVKESNFDYQKISQLEALWGDLTPFYILIGRFQSQKWKPEIPVLGRVFSSTLNDEFYKLKFEGLTEKEQSAVALQLKNLKHLEAWTKIRYRLHDLRSSDEHGQEAQKLKEQAIQDLLKTNLKPHLVEIVGSEECHKENPRGTLKCLMEELEAALKDRSKEKAIELLMVLKKSRGPLEISDALYTDLRALEKLLKGEVSSNKEGLVLTLNFWDPKWLLTIGDIVNTGSCQNFRTGSHIETLLGYVLDANVQGIASFVIAPQHFKDRKEYDRVREALHSGSILNIAADPQFRTTFFTKNGDNTTLPMDKAYLRHVLKLGQTENNGVGLRLERAYQQIHNASPQMQQQVKDIFNEIKSAIGATEGPISIARSRNPLGVYSDASGGVRTSDYCIQ